MASSQWRSTPNCYEDGKIQQAYWCIIERSIRWVEKVVNDCAGIARAFTEVCAARAGNGMLSPAYDE
jgi:hypothetical protein